MPNLRNGSEGVSNPGSLDCEFGILPLSYCSEVCSVSTMRLAYYCIGLVVDIIREAYDLFRPPTAIVSMEPPMRSSLFAPKGLLKMEGDKMQLWRTRTVV